MDGIFGVGLAEMLIIGLVLFIIGGPENSAKWARELGRFVRLARQEWAKIAAELESELGAEGREALDAMRELGQEVREVRTLPQQVLREAMLPEDAPASSEEQSAPAPSEDADDAPPVYTAWLPPQNPPSD